MGPCVRSGRSGAWWGESAWVGLLSVPSAVMQPRARTLRPPSLPRGIDVAGEVWPRVPCPCDLVQPLLGKVRKQRMSPGPPSWALKLTEKEAFCGLGGISHPRRGRVGLRPPLLQGSLSGEEVTVTTGRGSRPRPGPSDRATGQPPRPGRCSQLGRGFHTRAHASTHGHIRFTDNLGDEERELEPGVLLSRSLPAVGHRGSWLWSASRRPAAQLSSARGLSEVGEAIAHHYSHSNSLHFLGGFFSVRINSLFSLFLCFKLSCN